MAEVGQRDFLKRMGYIDDDITYDNGSVFLKGKYFSSATPKTDGKTYGEESDLAKAYRSYTQNETMSKYSGLLDNVSSRLNQQPKTFDKNTDQVYQSQLATAKANAEKDSKTAQNNAYALMRARGQGKSSWSDTVANQIQQNAYSNIALNLEPQYMMQAYNRFLEEQNAERLKTNDLLSLANTYNNVYRQGVQDDQWEQNMAETKKQNNLNLAQWGVQTYGYGDPKSDAGTFFNQYAGAQPLAAQQMERNNFESDRNYDRGVFESDRNYGLDAAKTNATIANMEADNARQAANAGSSKSTKQPTQLQQIEEYLAPYLDKDVLGKTMVKEPYQLRQAIIGLGLDDTDTIKLLERYGLPIQNPIYSGGR